MIQWIKDVLQNSWITKAFLVLLMVSFGIWGIGDFLSPGMSPRIAASVGESEIGLEEVQRRFGRELDRLKESMGKIDSDDMRRSVLNATVQDMVRETTLDAAAADMGMVVSNDQLRKVIRDDASFKDENGQFNQMLFTYILQENQLSEPEFLKLYTAGIRQRELIKPILDNATAPKTLTDTLLKYRGETRIADTLLVTAASVPAPAKPTDEELKKVYDDNIAAFTAPEYRKVKAVVLNSEELFPASNLTDEQLKAFHDENADRYRTRETKRVGQIVFDSKEQAEAARATMAAGDRLEEIARKAKTSVIDLGELPKASPLVKSMGAAYDLPVGEVSQPIQSDLGWHLFEVKDITPEVVRPYESVREEIRKTLAADKAVDALYDAAQSLEDAMVAGEPPEDIAQKINGRLIALEAVDRDGKDPRGLEAPGLIDNTVFLRTAFSLPSGGESRLMEIPKGYYMLKVEGITPPTPKPFEDVRAEVGAMAEKQKRMAAAREIAEKLAADIKPGTPMASKNGASYGQLGPINRFGQPSKREYMVDTARIGPEVLDRVFQAEVGAVVTAPVLDGIVVARLREVAPLSAEDAAMIEQQVLPTLRDGLGSDLAAALTQAFANRYPVELNQSTLDTIVGSTR